MRNQDRATSVEELGRVHVAVALAQAEMERPTRVADDGTPGQQVTEPDLDRRQVAVARPAAVGVQHGDRQSAGDRTGEDDLSGTDGAHR